jgi:type I restriction enzyme M protein
MAVRPVFVAQGAKPFVKTENTEFRFYPGFALSQSRKSIESLHAAFIAKNPEYAGKALEISTKSDNPLGVRLSAFNLLYRLSDGRKRCVENVFQAGKRFSDGNQYTEIMDLPASEAKRFPALRTSGAVVGFRLEGMDFPAEPKRLFYHWLYVRALSQDRQLADEVTAYRAFTDIVFNPQKSLNCQARSAALFVALKETGLLEEAVSSPERFAEIVFE